MQFPAMMSSLLWLGGIAFLLCLILTPIMRDVFRSYNVVDAPDASRKLHKYPIPRVGGIAIAIAYAAVFLLAPAPQGSVLRENLYLIRNLLPAAAVIFATGIIDDLFGLKPWQKLIGQFAAATLAYFAGFRILLAFGATGHWWSFPATVLWLLACSNAFNLVDGMDGLAGGIGLFSTLTIFIAALVNHSPALALAAFPLAACLLGFLCYNFNPATIFLGDSGSLLVGFLLGCFAIVWAHNSATLFGMTAPLMALSIPLLDTGVSIARRLLKRQNVFSADRGHIHHMLLDRGLTPRRAVLVVYLSCSVVACFSLLQSSVQSNRLGGMIAVLFCALAWTGVHFLGYAEFSVAGKMLFNGDFPNTLKAQLELRTFERALLTTSSVEDCWKLLCRTCDRCGFRCERLVYGNGRSLSSALSSSRVDELPRYKLRVPLSEGSYVEFSRPFNAGLSPAGVGPFVEAVHRMFGPRLALLLGAQRKAQLKEAV